MTAYAPLSWPRRETAEKEARGETVLAPGTRDMAILRGLIVARTTGSNVGRWLYNKVVVPATGKPKKAYKKIKLPLNTEKLIELLFRCLREGMEVREL